MNSANHLDDLSHYRQDHESARGGSENDSGNRQEVVEMVPELREDIQDGKDVGTDRPSLERKAISAFKRSDVVSWDGPDDPANPKNWTTKKKWAVTAIVSAFTFISPGSSSMIAPALDAMSRDLHVTSKVESQLMLSIFVLSYAVGPLFFAPLSELYGRVPVLLWSNLFYFVWNLACGFAPTKGQMFAFRLLSGLGGSAPLAIGGGVLSDCWRPEQRGKALSIYSLAPLLGPAVGPIAGGFITERTTWRWVFWATCIADAAIHVSGLLFLQETYAPKLLKIKAKGLRRETGDGSLRTEFERPDQTVFKKFETALIRPFRLLTTQPIIQVLAIYMAYLYGTVYLMLSTFPALWTIRYHQNVGVGGLNYISIGLGLFLGSQINAPINDRVYRKLKKRNHNVGQPEFRCPLMVPGAVLVPIGLFWYGWSAQASIHWIMPNIGACIVSAGIIVGFQCIQTYVVDAYSLYAASGIASITVLRSLAGFGFPLFAPYMYAALDYGWGNSVLAFTAICLGLPGPFLLWKFGPALRAKSQYAAGPSGSGTVS